MGEASSEAGTTLLEARGRRMSPSRRVGTNGGRLAGDPIAVAHDPDWPGISGERRFWLAIPSNQGRESWRLGVRVGYSRKMPGFRILRVPRVFPDGREDLLDAVGDALELVTRRPLIMRLTLGLLSPNRAVLERSEAILTRHGFVKAEFMRSYRHSVCIDLGRSVDDIFQSIHATARRHVRAVAKRPVGLKIIHDERYAARLDTLLRWTMARTSGPYRKAPWAPIIGYCRRYPDRARLVGLCRSEVETPDGLVAFALGIRQADHVEYLAAASERAPDLRFPLGYAPAWDLIQWSKSIGAEWFDFGGVTPGSRRGETSPRAGIADFKLMFGNDVRDVGREFVIEAMPRVNRILSRLGRFGGV